MSVCLSVTCQHGWTFFHCLITLYRSSSLWHRYATFAKFDQGRGKWCQQVLLMSTTNSSGATNRQTTSAATKTNIIDCVYDLVGLQCESKNPPRGTWHFFIFFTNDWELVIYFLHTYCTFLSSLDYKFLFNYHRFWRSYAILSATTQFT